MNGAWPAPRLVTGLGRGLTRRCPRCGQVGIFRRWVSMAEQCPRCGLRFERADGYWTGAIAINLLVTEAVFVVLLAAAIIVTWPDVPWTLVLVALIAVNILLPILFHPISRTLWVAAERHFHGWAEPDGSGESPRSPAPD